MDKQRALTYFVACAEEGSFAGAARRLEVSGPAVHKLVALLEASVGIRLFERSVRGLALTTNGSAYLEACRPMLAELGALERRFGARGSVPPERWWSLLIRSLPCTFSCRRCRHSIHAIRTSTSTSEWSTV